MRVLIIHRKPLFRDSLAALLRARIAGLELMVVPSLADGAMLMGQVPLGLLILEAEQGAGAQLLAALRLIYPGWRIALLGGPPGDVAALPVDGYLAADSDGETVVAEVGRLAGTTGRPPIRAAGETSRSQAAAGGPGLAETSSRRAPAASSQQARPLTRRQQDVLSLLAQGRSTKDIARTLDLGIGTIKAHLDGLYRTLGVHNRIAAVARVQAFSRPGLAPADLGLFDPDSAGAIAAVHDGHPDGHNVIRLECRPGTWVSAEADPATPARPATAMR